MTQRTMTAFTRFALVAATLLSAACGAQAGGDDTAMAAQLNRQADALRSRLLGLSSFAGLADECSAGELRVFDTDSSEVATRLLNDLERLIISYGAGTSLESPAGLALLRAVTRLETNGPGVAWDVMEGPAPRTFNPITTSRLPNPETKVCEDIPGLDPSAILLPQITGFEVPRDSMVVPVTVGYGPSALNELRDWHYQRTAGAADSMLRYVRVTTTALLGDYATVAVQRESERQGAVPYPALSSGASYVLHSVGGEWRLIGYSRVW